MTSPPRSDLTPLFERVRFIMVRPSHPGNVGAAARAIKTMGFGELCLVAPKLPDITLHPEAAALASGATDVLADALTVPTLADALAPITLAFALTARPRFLGPPAADIRESAMLAREHLGGDASRVAIVLGTERSGLTNDDIALCHRVCHIPANPEYSSLNVAQALQLAAWELRYALMLESGGATVPVTDGKPDPGALPASGERVQGFLAHWEQALVSVKFLDPEHPKKLVPRMRHLFTRNALSSDEVDMLRGVCTAMIKAAKAAYADDPPRGAGKDWN